MKCDPAKKVYVDFFLPSFVSARVEVNLDFLGFTRVPEGRDLNYALKHQ